MAKFLAVALSAFSFFEFAYAGAPPITYIGTSSPTTPPAGVEIGSQLEFHASGTPPFHALLVGGGSGTVNMTAHTGVGNFAASEPAGISTILIWDATYKGTTPPSPPPSSFTGSTYGSLS